MAATTHSAAIEDGDSSENESGLPRDKMLAGQSLHPVAASSKIGSRSICEKDRKIGHRRVNEEGQTSYKKIQSNQLMQSIQLGIQHSIVALGRYDERDLLMQDFMTVETAPFPRGGTSTTPTHSCSDFTFRTFAPLAFRYFLNLFGIKRQDFMVSLCSQALRELSNPGASGSIFYLTNDDEFILKTIMHKEAEFLQKLLPGYYMNLNQNPHTLLPKFFGMYCYQCNQKNIRIVIMNNLLPSNVRMHLRFDLKGSTYKRKASKHERAKSSPTYKDLDFMEMLPEGLLLEHETYNALISTLRRDCRVLESFRIMDYSLLVGVYNLDQAAKEAAENSSEASSSKDAGGRRLRPAVHKQKLVAHSTAMESIQAQADPIDEQDHLPPGGIPARNHKGERLLLFLGIIDILQSYRMRKKLEHTFKSIIHDGDTVSVHRPGFYAHRFLGFMGDRVFKKIPSLDLPEFKGAHRKFRTIVSSLIALKHTPSRKSKRESVKKQTSDAAGEDNHEPSTPPSRRKATATTSVATSSIATEHSTHETVVHTETHEINLPAVLWDRPSSGARARPAPSAPRSSSHPRSPREVPDCAFGEMGFDGGPTQAALASGARTSVQRGAAFRSQPDVVPASSVERHSRPRNRLHEQVKYGNLDASSSSRHSESSSHQSLGASSGWGTETPTWSERTPSYTESSRSHDGTPNKSTIGSGSREDIVTRSYKNSPYHETEI